MIIVNHDNFAPVPDMNAPAEVPLLHAGVQLRRALPPPSNEYLASVAPSLRFLYSVIDSYSTAGWQNWEEDDRIEALSELAWANEWLRWYRDEAPKLRHDFKHLLRRRQDELGG